MNRAELIEALATRSGVTKVTADKVVAELPCSRGKPRPSPVGVAREGQGRGWIAPLAQNPYR